MEWLESVVLISGLASVMLLWTVSMAGMLHVAWSTMSDQVLDAYDRLKRR